MSVSRETGRPTIASMGANAFGAQFEHRVSGSSSQDSMATISVSLSRANAGEAGTTLSSAVTVMGCGLSTVDCGLRAMLRRASPTSPLTACAIRAASALRFAIRSGFNCRNRQRDSGDCARRSTRWASRGFCARNVSASFNSSGRGARP